MVRINAKVAARGLHDGKKVEIVCIEEGGGGEEEGVVRFFYNGNELNERDDVYREIYNYSRMKYRKSPSHCYKAKEGTIEAYWLAFHEIFFDEAPEIEIEGDVNTFGSPFSDEDTSHVVF